MILRMRRALIARRMRTVPSTEWDESEAAPDSRLTQSLCAAAGERLWSEPLGLEWGEGGVLEGMSAYAQRGLLGRAYADLITRRK